VKLAINLENKKKYAIKIMREDQINTQKKLENFLNEVQLLSTVYHKNIVQIEEVNLAGEYRKLNGKSFKVAYYSMKFAEYGELFQILQESENFTERLARYYFHQLIEGMKFWYHLFRI
jgi:Serine/threonine protein kinase